MCPNLLFYLSSGFVIPFLLYCLDILPHSDLNGQNSFFMKLFFSSQLYVVKKEISILMILFTLCAWINNIWHAEKQCICILVCMAHIVRFNFNEKQNESKTEAWLNVEHFNSLKNIDSGWFQMKKVSFTMNQLLEHSNCRRLKQFPP